MLLRKTSWFWKSGLAVISFVLMLSVSGCSDTPPEEDTVSETVIDIQAIPEEAQENAEEIINICIDLYEKAAEENIDLVAGLTGEMLGEVFAWKEDEWYQELRTLGYYMGKFIYLMDAYEDLDKDIKKGNFKEVGINLHTIADFYAHSNYVELYMEYAKNSDKGITSVDAIPLFSDVYSNPNNYSGFLEILNDKLTTGIYNSMKEDFFSKDSKSHKQMNHDSPFSNMGRKKYNGIKGYKFARSLAEREINTIINSLNQN